MASTIPVLMAAARIAPAAVLLLSLPLPSGWSLLGQNLSLVGSAAEDYGVFFPEMVGDDEDEFSSGGHQTEITQAGPLYEHLDEQGALYVDASAFSSPRPYVSGFPQHIITVNPNFLATQQLHGINGEPIAVPQEEERWVILVPIEYKAFQSTIVSYFERYREESAPRSQREVLGLGVPARLVGQEISILWLAKDSSVFSFDARVAPSDGHYVQRPIIEVITQANSFEIDRMNTVTGDVNAPLKVPIQGTASETHVRLRPLLVELSLDDNLVALAGVGDHSTVVRPFSPWGAVLAVILYIVISIGHYRVLAGARGSNATRSVDGKLALVPVATWCTGLLAAYGYVITIQPNDLGGLLSVAVLVIPMAVILECLVRMTLRGRRVRTGIVAD